jgi:hypothetical protein
MRLLKGTKLKIPLEELMQRILLGIFAKVVTPLSRLKGK